MDLQAVAIGCYLGTLIERNLLAGEIVRVARLAPGVVLIEDQKHSICDCVFDPQRWRSVHSIVQSDEVIAMSVQIYRSRRYSEFTISHVAWCMHNELLPIGNARWYKQPIIKIINIEPDRTLLGG